MSKFLPLLPGITMLICYVIFKLYKLIKYSVKVQAKIIKHYDDYDTTSRCPVYEYSYNGMIYHYYSKIGIGGIEGKKRITKKIRINRHNPKKAYVSYVGLQLMYLFFTGIILFQGWILYVIHNY